MQNMSAHDDAWMAGLFEGEGTIWIKNRTVLVALTSTDYDVLEKLLEVAGCGSLGKEYRDNRPGREHYKPHRRWELRGIAECQVFLRRIYPYLMERRRAKADEVLSIIPMLDASRPGRRGGKDPNRLCRKGLHPMAGNRYCRECANTLRRKAI